MACGEELKELFRAIYDTEDYFNETYYGFNMTSAGPSVGVAVWVASGCVRSQDSFST